LPRANRKEAMNKYLNTDYKERKKMLKLKELMILEPWTWPICLEEKVLAFLALNVGHFGSRKQI
jgi:hypothetical protein